MLQQVNLNNAPSSTPIESPDIIVDVRNLVKSYNHKTAVNDVSFTVKQGEIVTAQVCWGLAKRCQTQ